jgi:TolB-like protein/AraC-like DNA-binding protein/Flp pilus assembly protein TadD
MTFGAGNEQEFIGKLTQLTLDHLADENFGGKELAFQAGISLSTLNRQLRKSLQKSPNLFIRNLRLQKAMELLLESSCTSSEVAFRAGFNSPAYFTKCFHDHFGYPPTEARKRAQPPSPQTELSFDFDDNAIQHEKQKPEILKIKQARLQRNVFFAAASLLLLLLVAFLFSVRTREFVLEKMGRTYSMAEKSILVLPFKNLSDEPGNQYFADGITEDILNHLFRISDLRVISRTTAERFRDSELATTEIAKSMGVNYLLEGSVRKQGNRVRITVQLIDGKRDRHLWSENYDRQLADIFFIQSDIAQNVARELRAVLSPKEIENIEKPMTKNIGAYDFYLRGRDYNKRSYIEDDFRFAMQLYQKAVEIDPDFALAWAGLATCSRRIYWFNFDLSEDNQLKTKQYLDKALTLSPELKEVRLEEAVYYYQCKLEYSRSVEILTKLQTEYPNDGEIYFWLAMVNRRMGEFKKSMEYNNLALSLNPSDWGYWSNAASTLMVLKNYKMALDYARKAFDLNPSYPYLFEKLFEIFLRTGQIEKARDLHNSNEKSFDTQDYLFRQMQLAFLERNFNKAAQFAQSLPDEGIFTQTSVISKHLQLGMIYRTASNREMSKKHFELARDFYLEKIKKSDNDWRLYGSLGIACAGLGLKEEALEAGNKAIEFYNINMDAYSGWLTEMQMVNILIFLEEYSEALPRLEQIIQTGWGLISVEVLKLDPFWDPVREHPKFKEIINNPAYQVRL